MHADRLAGREGGVEGVLAAYREVVDGVGHEAQAAAPNDGEGDVVHDGLVGRRVAGVAAAGVLAQAAVAGAFSTIQWPRSGTRMVVDGPAPGR